MSLTFKNFEDKFTVPRKAFDPETADEELALISIFFGQFVFDLYYGCRQVPVGSPMVIARWDRRRHQLSEELKGDTFTLPVDFAKELYDQLSTPSEWEKTAIFPKATLKDGTEKEQQLNFHGAALFLKAMSTLVEQLLDYFEPPTQVPEEVSSHDASSIIIQ